MSRMIVSKAANDNCLPGAVCILRSVLVRVAEEGVGGEASGAGKDSEDEVVWQETTLETPTEAGLVEEGVWLIVAVAEVIVDAIQKHGARGERAQGEGTNAWFRGC